AEKSFRACLGDVGGQGRPDRFSLMAAGNLVWSLAELGRFDEALERGRAAVHLSEELDRRMNLVHALWALADAHRVQGHARDATPPGARALALPREWEVQPRLNVSQLRRRS